MTETTWPTDDGCPSCGARMTACLYGGGTATWYCPACGHETTWQLDLEGGEE